MVGLGDNVFYDDASTHEWAILNETVFLERVVAELKAQMGDAFLDYTFSIVSSRDGRVRPQSLDDPAPRKVLIVISDETGSIPADLAPHYVAVFKSYLPRELPGTNIFPFNIGYVREVPEHPAPPVEERAISLFFSGNLSRSRLPLYRALHPVYRRLPYAVLRELWARRSGSRLMPEDVSRSVPGSYLRFTNGFQTGLPPAEYGRLLTESRIALCPRGASSAETFRHIEAMRAGAVVVSERLPETHFYSGAPVVTVDDWTAGIERAKELLDDQAALSELQRDTLGWWETVCSEAATARYMREMLTTVCA